MNTRGMIIGAGMGILAALLLACPNPAKSAIDDAALAVCILNHDSEPIQQIVDACAGATAQVVADVLGAHRAAMERQRSREKLQDAGTPAAAPAK